VTGSKIRINIVNITKRNALYTQVLIKKFYDSFSRVFI